MANFAAKHLNNVILSADVYAVCLQHALTTEKEEIMGLLIGEVDDMNVSHITACVILHRSDKQPDRVEISPEQLCTASTAAEQLTHKLKRPMRVLGWYHSHPHITVWPSHVGMFHNIELSGVNLINQYNVQQTKENDVRTQSMYQTMDPLFVGLIFSVFQSDKGSVGNQFQLTCFQANSSSERRDVQVIIKNSPLEQYNLQEIAKLPRILAQEEVEKHDEENNECEDLLAELHNEAYKTLNLVHLISKVSRPLYEDLEARLNATNIRIRELEKVKKKLIEALII